jgi:hypothetical protein
MPGWDHRQIVSGFPAFQWDIVFQSYQPTGFLAFFDDLTDLSDVIIDRFAWGLFSVFSVRFES